MVAGIRGESGTNSARGGRRKKPTLLLDIEPLAGTTPLRDRLGEHSHEVLVVVLGPSRELAQVKGRRELHGGLLRVADDLGPFMLVPLLGPDRAVLWEFKA